VHSADISYAFSLYEAEFLLEEAGSYSGVIELTQKGGLRGTYFKTVDFQSPVELLNLNDLDGEKYTQIDSNVDFDVGYDALIASYPTEYFSVMWQGKVRAPTTQIYKFYVDSFNSSSVSLVVNGTTLIDSFTSPEAPFYGIITLQEDELYDIELRYSEKLGKTKVSLQWEADTFDKQVISEEYLYNVLYSSTTPFAFTVVPSVTSPITSSFANSDYMAASSGVLETLFIYARDEFGNQ